MKKRNLIGTNLKNIRRLNNLSQEQLIAQLNFLGLDLDRTSLSRIENHNREVYNKLVRDRIPEIIESSRNKCEVEVVSDEVALEYLYKKLNEEVGELLEDKNLDEIADCLEVLFAIGAKYGYSENEVLGRRNEKKLERGGFLNNIVLKLTK